MKFYIVIITICFSLLVGCSSNKKPIIDVTDRFSAEELYEKGMSSLKKNDLKKASAYFGQVAYEFPYHNLSNKAEVMEIYSNYLMAEYEEVAVGAEQFVKLHPASSEVPYVLYLKSLSFYEQIDIPYRDQEVTRKAKKALTEVIKRFPKSKYAKDSRIKLELVNDHLAAYEMIIGRYYLNSGSILSAINRFKTVADHYNRTSHIQEALYRLVEAYSFLGLKEEAKRNASVLGYNYPTSKWYKESYNIVKN